MNDDFFRKAVQPFCWIAAFFLFLAYAIGLWFTLRTHAAVIWATDGDEKKAAPGVEVSMHDSRHAQIANGLSGLGDIQSNSIRETQLYRRILGHSLQQIGLPHEDFGSGPVDGIPPHLDPGLSKSPEDQHGLHLRGLTEEDNESLARQVAEVAATAATVAARDSTRNHHRRTSANPQTTGRAQETKATSQPTPITEEHEFTGVPVEAHAGGGHDAPNWSKTKSAIILLGATVLYAVIAEILVDTVDVVLESVDIDEKFLGITLFALVPNTTEFLVCFSICLTLYMALTD